MIDLNAQKLIALGKKHWRAIVGIGGLAVIIAWSGGACNKKVSPDEVAFQEGIPLPSNTETLTVQPEETASRIDVIGTTASDEKINLSARLSAYVKEVFVSAGDTVKKGQVLVALDDREIREQLTAAEAQFKQAEVEYQRTQQLIEKNASTDQALTAAESMFNAARAQVEQVKVMLTYAQITSPIDGIVTERRIEAGDLANPGQVLLAVYDPTRMRLEAPVPLRLIEKLSLNQEVEVTLDRPAKTYKGKVSEIVSEVDPLSRTQKVKVRIEGAAGEVLPGTFGRLWVEADRREALCVPSSAVYRVGQLEMVQVAKNGRAVQRLVKTGPRTGDKVEVISGLQAGDAVVLAPVRED